ncbi:DnaD domain protein [Natronospora cellulosivora (SeqCode)]
MTDNIIVQNHKKLSIATASTDKLRSIEIADTAVDNGFLTQFPGASLAIFLYLITHINDNNLVQTNPTIISSYIADSFQISDINKGLNYLSKNDIIEVSAKREGDYTYSIRVKLENLNKNLFSNIYGKTMAEQAASKESSNEVENRDLQRSASISTNPYYDQRQVRTDILAIPDVSRAELFKAILTFIPSNENLELLENRINQWLEDFETKMIKELIRRVNKWLENHNNSPDKAFYYLKGIVDDWYKKDIRTYKDLQYYDKLFRETREIANLYGLNEWHNVKPSHIETFHRWLEDGFPLSVELIKLAIKEAYKRKKDGQASLKYIEDNFILPWKEKKIRTSKQAMRFLNKSKFKDYKKSKKNSTNNFKRNIKKNSNEKISNEKIPNAANWDNISWDFED